MVSSDGGGSMKTFAVLVFQKAESAEEILDLYKPSPSMVALDQDCQVIVSREVTSKAQAEKVIEAARVALGE
jgi:hypothetical protein